MADTEKKDSFSASTSTAAKKPLAELKNGKVIFKQKSISFEKSSEAMQEIVKFREMLEQRIEMQEPSTYCYSRRTQTTDSEACAREGVTPLAKHIRSELLPSFDEDDDSSRESISVALPLIDKLWPGWSIGYKLPPIVCVWRWEVKDDYRDWLPKSAKERAEARIAERVQAKTDLRAVFESLPQDERDAILDPKGINKLPTKDTNKPNPPSNATAEQADAAELKDSSSQREPSVSANEPENIDSGSGTPKARQRKVTDAEKVAKAKEKEEKKAARAEKEKKQKATQDKSRSLMANFFGKAKAPPRESPSKPVCGASNSESDFQKTFKPFILKKDAEMAPVNWFLKPSKRTWKKQTSGFSPADAIVVDDAQASGTNDIDVFVYRTPVFNHAEANAQERLQDVMRSLRPLRLTKPCNRSKSSFKSFSACNAKDIYSQLNDAEIAGDTSQVRYLSDILWDRKILPAKVLIFHEDARPGYYGSWTKNSRIVGPRSPFARDLLARDYGYDSGEEWEDEGAADADNVDDDDDDEGDGEEGDSDLESWLVDDDEIEIVPDDRDLSPSLLDIPLPPPKRKAEPLSKQPEKKRKIVVPLVPYTKGPLWESVIGQCEYDPFKPYRIQLFNDTPYPIDPFTFVAKTAEESQQPNYESKFAIPSLPNRLLGNNSAAESPAAAAAQASANKRATPASTPKTTFPDAHVPFLISKITTLATANLTFIVESVHQELREHKVKKNAIEAKVREVAEKSKEKKIWVIREGQQL
ncbi:uncharacterized protein BJ212DRAFT_1474155 [Suillus subaureus]|uniref:Chromatin assembly factor 1 subunit A dimerization domain-containing protein n=1 Tax=Suillus subaureus TaxID=48587 RepID=A0A9P7ENC0_9AGAM|nr:uncharacterized protein BJ212DRAFT_1474155 [Suillus subaureus]KAG1826950.1 hypothetical protein BJ212DRAFT_1474155 [Suillus subaureus]